MIRHIRLSFHFTFAQTHHTFLLYDQMHRICDIWFFLFVDRSDICLCFFVIRHNQLTSCRVSIHQNRIPSESLFFLEEEKHQTLISFFVISHPRLFWNQTHQTLTFILLWKVLCSWSWHWNHEAEVQPEPLVHNATENTFELLKKWQWECLHGKQGFLECRPHLGMA